MKICVSVMLLWRGKCYNQLSLSMQMHTCAKMGSSHTPARCLFTPLTHHTPGPDVPSCCPFISDSWDSQCYLNVFNTQIIHTILHNLWLSLTVALKHLTLYKRTIFCKAPPPTNDHNPLYLWYTNLIKSSSPLLGSEGKDKSGSLRSSNWWDYLVHQRILGFSNFRLLGCCAAKKAEEVMLWNKS